MKIQLRDQLHLCLGRRSLKKGFQMMQGSLLENSQWKGTCLNQKHHCETEGLQTTLPVVQLAWKKN